MCRLLNYIILKQDGLISALRILKVLNLLYSAHVKRTMALEEAYNGKMSVE